MEHEGQSGVPIEELLRRARAGEAGALEELFRRSQPVLGRWAARSARQEQPGGARPSDMTQVAAMRAFERFATFNGTTEAEWFAWLKSVFRSQVAQLFKEARRKKRAAPSTVSLDSPEALEARSPHKTPSQAAYQQEEWRILLASLYQLPEEQSTAIYLCQLKDLPVAEVARQMGKTVAAVAGLQQRGLKALRERAAGGEASEPEAASALLDWLQRRDEGRPVDPESFIAEHPECADELRSMLQWIERLRALRPASTQQ